MGQPPTGHRRRIVAKFLMLGIYLQATAVELFHQEKVLPPDPGPRSSTKTNVAKGAGFTRSTTPANYYLLANPRLAEAPESGTSVLCTGQGSFGCKVNYILTPMYPQHMTLTEYEIIAVNTSMENAVNTRAIGMVSNAIKARESAHIFRIPGLHKFLPEEQLSATEQEQQTVLGDLQSHNRGLSGLVMSC